MRITSAKLTKTIYTPGQYEPLGLPEIAVVGRSNAGKSSLINRLCNNSKLARVSSEPGKTRSVNFFTINQTFVLVDLPGYGFARRSAAERRQWAELIEGYFDKTEALRHLLLLCDIRHDASEGDLQMVQWLQYYGIPYTLVATKADKVAKSKRPMRVAALGKQVQTPARLAFSATESLGKEALLEALESALDKKEVKNFKEPVTKS